MKNLTEQLKNKQQKYLSFMCYVFVCEPICLCFHLKLFLKLHSNLPCFKNTITALHT